MTAWLRAVGTVLLLVAGAVLLTWLAEKMWAKLSRSCSSAAPKRRRLRRRPASAPVPWTQLALRALAFASNTSMGVYLPAAGWDDDTAACVVEESQVLMATVEGDTLVVDCLVPSEVMATGDRRLWLPFTLRARLACPMATRPIPASLTQWVETGAPVEVWIGRGRDGPFVRLTGAGSRLTLELRSLGQCLGQLPEKGLGRW